MMVALTVAVLGKIEKKCLGRNGLSGFVIPGRTTHHRDSPAWPAQRLPLKMHEAQRVDAASLLAGMQAQNTIRRLAPLIEWAAAVVLWHSSFESLSDG